MASETDDLYESLPTHKYQVHLIAGAAAGIGEHCLMYPIDSVKTRMQSLCADCPERRNGTPLHALWKMMKREGFWRPIHGVTAIAFAAVPAHALYFTVYEKFRYWICSGQMGNFPLASAISGCAATACHDLIMNPAEVVKQRMQMYESPYRGCMQCAKYVFRREGVIAFYRSYPTQLILNVPFHSLHFVCYDFCQQHLNPHRVYDPKSHIISGAAAGGIAAALTTPFDVCKTVLNTQEFTYLQPVSSLNNDVSKQIVSGLRGAFRTIIQTHGFLGFFNGLQARILFQMPATAIAWSVYEFFKYFISSQYV